MKPTRPRLYALFAGMVLSLAAQAQNISIATGGTGGVYYPLGGGIAAVLSKHVPGMQATAEVTGGSVDNLKLIGSGKPYVGFTMTDAGLDAYRGEDKFKGNKVPLKTLMILYPNRMHIASVEGRGIAKMADLKGKRVSLDEPGSGTLVNAKVILAAYGITEKDFKPEYLKPQQAAEKMKDGAVDAFFSTTGYPQGSITELAATSGIELVLEHATGQSKDIASSSGIPNPS